MRPGTSARPRCEAIETRSAVIGDTKKNGLTGQRSKDRHLAQVWRGILRRALGGGIGVIQIRHPPMAVGASRRLSAVTRLRRHCDLAPDQGEQA
jgi:hypothetical protein